jgi:hypothetical protein
MVDVAATVGRIRGMVVDPDATLAEHVQPVPPWAIVAREHAVPLIAGSAAVSTVLSLAFVPAAGTTGGGLIELLVLLLVRVAVNFGMVALMAALVAFFAGMFNGANDFNRGFVLVTLAMTPLYVGEAVLPIPLLGTLAALGGLIYSMIILYRNIPVAMNVPRTSRGRHFFMTLASMFLILMIAGLALGPFLLPEAG